MDDIRISSLLTEVYPMSMGLGDRINGNSLAGTHFRLRYKEDLRDDVSCVADTPSVEEQTKLRKAIEEMWEAQLFIDGDLPVWVRIGEFIPGYAYSRGEDKYFLFTHTHFEVHYHGEHVVSVSVDQPLEKALDMTDTEQVGKIDVQFTYSVTWMPTADTLQNRLKRSQMLLPRDEGWQDNIRFYTNIYTCVALLVLLGHLAMILKPAMACTKQAPSKGSQVLGSGSPESQRDHSGRTPFGIKIVILLLVVFFALSFGLSMAGMDMRIGSWINSDVFQRFLISSAVACAATSAAVWVHGNDTHLPSWSVPHNRPCFPAKINLFCSFIGAGTQLLCLCLVLLVLGVAGLIYPYSRGAVYPAAIILYTLTSVIAGFTSALYYKQMGGEHWRCNHLLTSTIYFGPFFVVSCLLNILAHALKLSTKLELMENLSICNWCTVGFILTKLGTILGRNISNMPCCTIEQQPESDTPRPPWYRTTIPQMLLSGIPPFLAICTDLETILEAVWVPQFRYEHREVYMSWPRLLIAFIVLGLMATLIGITTTHGQLANGNRPWCLRTFLCSGSASIYVYGYCILHCYQGHASPIQAIFCLGYMSLMPYALFLVLGSIGWHTSLLYIWILRSPFNDPSLPQTQGQILMESLLAEYEKVKQDHPQIHNTINCWCRDGHQICHAVKNWCLRVLSCIKSTRLLSLAGYKLIACGARLVHFEHSQIKWWQQKQPKQHQADTQICVPEDSAQSCRVTVEEDSLMSLHTKTIYHFIAS